MNNDREILIEKMADNLPVLRKKLKLSQEGLAQMLGTSRFTIVLIETKKRSMTWNTFLALVFVFDHNKETSVLLRTLGIFNSTLENIIKVENNVKQQSAER